MAEKDGIGIAITSLREQLSRDLFVALEVCVRCGICAEICHYCASETNGSCTLCRRCVINCPMGVDTALLMRTARSVITASGRAPEILVQLADTAIAREQNLGLFRDLMLGK